MRLSASVSHALSVGKLNVGINNLLDEDYFTYYSQTVNFAQNDRDFFKGRGRTVTLGYQVSF